MQSVRRFETGLLLYVKNRTKAIYSVKSCRHSTILLQKVLLTLRSNRTSQSQGGTDLQGNLSGNENKNCARLRTSLTAKRKRRLLGSRKDKTCR